jgi:uncharacterized protein (TIGR03086 family)
MELLAALDMAHAQFEQALRRVPDDQWTAPTPCTDWNVYQVANHVLAGGDYFMALLDGASKEDALDWLLAADVLQPDPVSAFVAQRPRVRAAFTAPGALEKIGHHVLADMTGAQLLHGCVTEAAVHTWDITKATSNDQGMDEQLAKVALATMEQLAPIFVANGFAAPSVEIAPDAPVQARLIALSGRQP